MRDYGKVHTSFWTSSTITSLSEDGKLLALYLLTCPHGNLIGTFRLSDGYICDDIGWPSERVSKGFGELFQKGFANRCETTKWVLLNAHLKWNPLENPNQRKAALKIANQIPDNCAWKLDFMRVCGHLFGAEPYPPANPSETVSEPFRNQEQEQEQEQEHKTPSASLQGFVLGDAEAPAEPESDADDGRLPSCPHQEIIALWHTTLPSLPRTIEWNETRRRLLQGLWRRKAAELRWPSRHEGLAWFADYFAFVGQSPFLTGKTQPHAGRTPFVAELEWVIRPQNFAKIVEGKYHAGTP